MELLKVQVSVQSRFRLQYLPQRALFAVSQYSYRLPRRRAHFIPSSRTFQTSSPSASASRFTYRISASFSGKGHRFDPKTNVYDFNSSTQFPPHLKDSKDQSNTKAQRKKRPDSGQDAYFISSMGESDAVAFGVADGVGGWADSGIDSADFAHGFCGYMADSAFSTEERKRLTARDLMTLGYQKIVADRTVLGGGSTACVAVARGDGSLEVAK